MLKMLLSDDYNDERFFGKGDVVCDRDSDGECIVIGSWREWLWLDPMDDATPFVGRASDYRLVNRGCHLE